MYIAKFDPNLIIETDRLLLRPFNMNDLDSFSLICADPMVMRYIRDGAPLDREATKQLLLWIISRYEEQGFGLLALTLRENKTLLGFCGLIEQTVDEKLYIELGYRLSQDFWGKGIATEAAQAIRNYAFSELNLPNLISIIHSENLPSKRVAQKVGMKHMKRTHFKDVLVDVFYMKPNSI